MLKEKVYRTMIELTNSKTTSKMLQHIMTSPISKSFIPSYKQFYEINTKEVSQSIDKFTSLQNFFTRELIETARLIDTNPHHIVSPVDAKIESFGEITPAQQFVVKGKNYSLRDLLGKDEHAAHYKNGQYIIFYLSPADYHRMHSPVDGTVLRQYVLGNRSYPVNKLGLTYGKQPLSHNYRLVTELQSTCGRTAFIKVGAMFVNSIKLTNTTERWVKGEEVGYFEFGSTVIMLFKKDCVTFFENVQKNAVIRVGEAFADVL